MIIEDFTEINLGKTLIILRSIKFFIFFMTGVIVCLKSKVLIFDIQMASLIERILGSESSLVKSQSSLSVPLISVLPRS